MDLSLLGEKQEIAARDKADKIAGILANAGIRTAVRIETGIPFKEILRAEAEEDISLIVIGSHGVSNVKEMLLGSVSGKWSGRPENRYLLLNVRGPSHIKRINI
jgi:nucleotide-binding universal stress UspA family protein